MPTKLLVDHRLEEHNHHKLETDIILPTKVVRMGPFNLMTREDSHRHTRASEISTTINLRLFMFRPGVLGVAPPHMITEGPTTIDRVMVDILLTALLLDITISVADTMITDTLRKCRDHLHIRQVSDSMGLILST